MLKDALRGSLSEQEIAALSSSFDVIGDIAIVKIPPELKSKEKLISEHILAKMKSVKTVLKQDTPVGGEFRTRAVSFIGGEEKFETIYKESGLVFKVNVQTAYFSPRLSTERLRIRALVSDGEKIFNMFAGIGTFSLIIAKTKSCVVESVDKNTEAIRLAFDSLKLNKKLKGTVHPILADAKEFAFQHVGAFDRVLMPLPERVDEFLESAVLSARKDRRATIHYYCHVPEDKFRDIEWIGKHLEESNIGRKYEITTWKRVREVGPRLIQAVADIELEPV
ncbi:MAG: class I SAM-dependent methyltransferase family protein [Nitrososphaerota archaeon]|nr:class I SAM-dependent methyltransferase family protein [Nitrososphaerota archaeon]